MFVYLLFYDTDEGNREDWNVFYTACEAFSTPELRAARQTVLEGEDPNLEFHTEDLEIDKEQTDAE